DGSSFSVKASVSTDGVNWTDHGQGECSKMSSDDHGRGPHHPGHGGHHGDHPADDGGGSDNP
ncbi:MAG TPA: hypothetical protein VFH51_05620, partial [Myxococcota bacterium]|nr:hypothetical protein [Myxococcota bacterium]